MWSQRVRTSDLCHHKENKKATFAIYCSDVETHSLICFYFHQFLCHASPSSALLFLSPSSSSLPNSDRYIHDPTALIFSFFITLFNFLLLKSDATRHYIVIPMSYISCYDYISIFVFCYFLFLSSLTQLFTLEKTGR